jgi:hypothetical protein
MKSLARHMPSAKPEDVGFSSERLAYIDSFLTEKVNHGDLAGIVTLVRHNAIHQGSLATSGRQISGSSLQ